MVHNSQVNNFRNLQKTGFIHKTSSPHFPQSNGQAERAVQTVKNLIKKAADPYKAIMDYRNTNIEDIVMSPSQLYLGRRIKTDIPVTTNPITTSVTEWKQRNKIAHEITQRQI